MGMMKRLMEEREAKGRVALQILIQAKVLKLCEYHKDTILEGVGIFRTPTNSVTPNSVEVNWETYFRIPGK